MVMNAKVTKQLDISPSPRPLHIATFYLDFPSILTFHGAPRHSDV